MTAGGTTSVSFYNKLNTGSAKMVKTTNTGANLSGWQIGLYTDADCTNAVAGSPFTTGADGTVTVSGLQKGTYYAKENPTDDPYWEFDTAVKSVTVAVGQTAEVTFTNTHYGRIEIRKTTNTGNQLGGWTFRVRDSEGNSYGDFTTDDNGYACTDNLPLGRYTVVELPTEDNYWLTELGFHDVTVKAGETTVDTWLNKEQGLAWFYKKTNTGESVEGWHITVYLDEACTQKVGTLITNEDGRAGYYLDPGTYWAKETGDEQVSFVNALRTGKVTVEKIDITGSPLAGATFRLEWSAEGSLWYPVTYSESIVRGGCSNPDVTDGSLTTGADGILEWDSLYPGLQYRLTETKAPDGYKLLTKPAYEGELPADDLVCFVNSVNDNVVLYHELPIPAVCKGTGPALRAAIRQVL